MKNAERLELILKDPRKALHYALRSDFFNRCEDFAANLIRPPSDEIVNANELRVLGMQRSGHHAVMEWLTKSFGGASLHINDVPPGQNAYRHGVQYPAVDAPESLTQRMRKGRFKHFETLNLLVLNYEDRKPADVFRDLRDPLHDLHYGRSGRAWNVLVLRDPLNMLASRIKSGKTGTRTSGGQVELWLEHAEYALNAAGADDFVLIKYNDWVASRDYRFELQERFGLKRQEISTEDVSAFGKGSSFDGTNMNGRASEMAVLDRWKTYRDDPEFAEFLKNEELLRYHAIIFGQEYG